MKPTYRTRMKKMLMETPKELIDKEEGSTAGTVLALFLVIILIVGFVVIAVKFGYDLNGIVTAFRKFFGLVITLGGR